MRKFWIDESGSLMFEWILVLVLLVIGIVGGTAAVRDALIVEAGETAQATIKIDSSYTVNAPISLSLTNMKTTGTLKSATISAFSISSKNSNVTIN